MVLALVRPTAEEVKAAFPEAVAFAKAFREVFGDAVKLTYARNQQGQEIGRPLLHTRNIERLSTPALI